MSVVENVMADHSGAEQIILEVNGHRFHALSQGSLTDELVLFLHGFPQFADVWSEIMPAIAAAGFHAVAVDQRGYSAGSRPDGVEQYSIDDLSSDALGFAESLGAGQFHVVGHDWGGLLAWKLAADHPDRVRSLTVLSTPHHDAFFEAIRHDDDQRRRSQYIDFFRMPDGAAEAYFVANDWQFLRRVYQGKVSEARVQENIRRLSEPGALTATLNWYRALDTERRIGKVTVPTLYIWGSEDMALGAGAAVRTADYVSGSYDFEPLDGKSHWLIEEVPEWIATRVLRHLSAVRTRSAGTPS